MKKGPPSKENCPKCGATHLSVPTKPTLCPPCQKASADAAAEKKRLAAEAKSASDAQLRVPLLNPLSLPDLNKARKVLPGDVLVRTKDGYYFFPAENNKLSQESLIKLLVFIPDVATLSDWGGVAELFLQPDKKYLEDPPKIRKEKGAWWIYSYTPVPKLKEAEEMWSSASASGFDGLIITTLKGDDPEKPNDLGKSQLLTLLFSNWKGLAPDYYEDTAGVLDLVPDHVPINKFWVVPKNPEFKAQEPKSKVTWIEQEEFVEKLVQK